MPVDVGQIVANKYELVRLLGRGSMGEVWSAHHNDLREQVALKFLAWTPDDEDGDDAEDPAAALARFRFEAQVAARLSRRTRHIARVTDYGEDDGLTYLVMELLDGEPLDAALRARGPLGLAEAVEIVSQIARALVHAHAEGVAHRDLKPANVFLSRDEEGRLLVKLLDFGIARATQKRRSLDGFATARGLVFGTPGYMSPEQSRPSAVLDHRCDLWALATIAYELLTGHLPVEGDDADEVMRNIAAGRIVPLLQRAPRMPAAVGAFFGRAFAENVDERFAGAASLAQAFELAAGGGISGVMQVASVPSLVESSVSTAIQFSASVAPEALPAPRRRPGVVATALVGTLVAAVSIAAGRAAWHGASRATPDTVIAAATIAAPPQSTAGAAAAATITPALPALAAPQPAVREQVAPVIAPAAAAVATLATPRRPAGDRVAPRAIVAQTRPATAAEAPSPQPSRAPSAPAVSRDDVF
jgi:serine/threonine-protein kinase